MYLRIILLAGALSLGACATTPAYQPANSENGYGYYSTSLGQDRHRVTYNGNSGTGLNTVTDYALLRAAELTVEQGKDWFLVLERSTDRVERSTSSAGISRQRDEVVYRDCGLLGCRTTTRPAHTSLGVDAHPRQTYSVSMEIATGNNPVPAEDGRYYDAQALIQQLREGL